MSNQLAVDVVLLPPKEVMQSVIDLISYTSSSVITLDTHSCLPHISLAMGILKQDDVETAKILLHKIAEQHVAVNTSLVATKTHTIPGDLQISDVTVKKDGQLLGLQKNVLDTFGPLLTHANVTTEMFSSPPEVAEISTSWVQNYYENNKTTDGFRPHITLGEGEMKVLTDPITFKTERLALCHLGNYCTCRKILAEVQFS